MSWKRMMTQVPLRWLAAPSYAALVRAQLSASRVCRAAHRTEQPTSLDDVTALIRTFERPNQLRRLVASLGRFHPGVRILVVDDSRVPTELPGAKTITLPFDSGVGFGRNAGLAEVQTPFVLNLDDDYAFCESYGLHFAKRWLDAHPEVALAAGRVTDLPWFRELDTQVESLGTRIDDRPLVQYGLNFYLGRTEAVRSVGYDPALRRVEHRDFFRRCAELQCVHLEELHCLHAQTPFDANYRKHREDVASDIARLRRKWG